MIVVAPTNTSVLAELIFEFRDVKVHVDGGQRRAAASLRVRYRAPGAEGATEGNTTEFISPWGPIEADALRWYVEDYCDWPFGAFRERAEKIEHALPTWGRLLFDAISRGNEPLVQQFLQARSSPPVRLERRVSVCVEGGRDEGPPRDGETLIWGLPWELMHDGRSFLFEGAMQASIQRNLHAQGPPTPPPNPSRARVLLIIARPEDERVALLDPRSSAVPLLDALGALGDYVDVDVLHDGTLDAFRKALMRAQDTGNPYHIVHFDGHGYYDPARGGGMLCFEDAEDVRHGAIVRRPHLVRARDIGGLLRDMQVLLFVLDACQSGAATDHQHTSVVAELMHQGVTSAIAMPYVVRVDTSSRFVASFYGALARGKRIGRATVEARLAMKSSPLRLDFRERGHVDLMDWMVPILFQNGDDPRIFDDAGDETAALSSVDLQKRDGALQGEMPARPRHGFVGRVRELVFIDRQLPTKRSVSLLGLGGEGKTALAIEAARWLLLTRRVACVVFVSVERLDNARAILDVIGQQLIAGYSSSMVDVETQGRAVERVTSVLRRRKTLLIIDNFESILDQGSSGNDNVEAIVRLLERLMTEGKAWLLTTSRTPLPPPFDSAELHLEQLGRVDALHLLQAVLRDKGVDRHRAGKTTEEWVSSLELIAGAVHRHARSLVLLGPTLVRCGLNVTQEMIRREMQVLDRKYPQLREKSLFASVRVSLQRIDDVLRRNIVGLSSVRRAIPMELLASVLEVDAKTVPTIVDGLVTAGLARESGVYLVVDPALGATLAMDADAELLRGAERRWHQAMAQWAAQLYQRSNDDYFVAQEGLNVLWVDLLEALEGQVRDAMADPSAAERVMVFATDMEQVVALWRRLPVLRRIVAVREALLPRLPLQCRARFLAHAEAVERRMGAAEARAAHEQAVQLVAYGDGLAGTYPEAGFDQARARVKLGRTLLALARPADALTHFQDAQKRAAELVRHGNVDAVRLESVATTDCGNALLELRRLDEAATCFRDGIERDRKRNAWRDVAIGLGQLGTTYLQQRQLDKAMGAWMEARQHFEDLSYSSGVCTSLHQIGRIFELAEKFGDAERAYKESLARSAASGDRLKEAGTLGQVGRLYQRQDKLEEAATFYRQASSIFEEIADDAGSFRQHTNLGIVLHLLGRHDDARRALLAAIAARDRVGFSYDAWVPWCHLATLEREAKRTEAEAWARTEAMAAYSAYRDAGGTAPEGTPQLIHSVGLHLASQRGEVMKKVLHAIRTKTQSAPSTSISHLLNALDEVLNGQRDEAVADDPNLDPIHAAELRRMLRALAAPNQPPGQTIAHSSPLPPNQPTSTPIAPPMPTNAMSQPFAFSFPQPLVEAYQRGELAILFGSGLSMASDVKGQFPTWTQLPERLLEQTSRQGIWSQDQVNAMRTFFQTGHVSLEQMLVMLDMIKTPLRQTRKYRTALTAIFRPDNAAPGDVHKALKETGVDVLLTTNYDALLELVEGPPVRHTYTWKAADEALDDLRSGRKILFKVHGTAEDQDSVVMTRAEYENVVQHEPYQRAMSYLLQRYTWLLVGYGINDPLDLDLVFALNTRAFKAVATTHYALVRGANASARDRWQQEMNVQVVPYANHDDLPAILRALSATKKSPATP